MLPMLNDQGLAARLLHERKVGIEIPRKEIDGSFTSDAVAKSVRLAMVESSGQLSREIRFRFKQSDLWYDVNNRNVSSTPMKIRCPGISCDI